MRHTIALLTLTGLLAACSDSGTDAEQTQTSNPAKDAMEMVEKAVPEQVAVVEETMQDSADKAEEAMEEVAEAAEEVMSEATSEAAAPAPAASGEPKVHVVGTQITAFVPMVVFIQPGDTVKWTNMAAHDTTSLEGMIPEGAEPWHSQMGEEYSVTLTEPGAYIYKCTPHASMGMIAAIIVGDEKPANLEAINNSPENKGMVGRTIRKLMKALEERG